MSVSGLCQICQSRPAAARCDNCGTIACADHYEEGLGICLDCKSGRRLSDPQPDVTDVNQLW